MEAEAVGGGVAAFPLSWPAGWDRTRKRGSAQFQTRFAQARDELLRELRLMGARQVVLSSNLPLRRDGLPYAKMPQPQDPGVAVYFRLKDRSMVFACDRWHRVEDNVQAIRKTVEALRGIERWGASELLERAFQGFKALPAAATWWEVLGVERTAPWWEVERRWKELARAHHPDRGGSTEQMARINAAVEQAKREKEAP